MRIVLVGAGVVGFHLAEHLSRGGHDISVVDNRPELIRQINDKMDVLAILGDASIPSVLERAGAVGADLVIAVTDRDTTNLLVSLIARRMGAKKCIVRVRNSEFSGTNRFVKPEDVGADLVINTVNITADRLERLVRNPGATDVAEFADGDLFLWGFNVSPASPLVGVKLKELRQRYGTLEALIVAIYRSDGSLVIPTGDDELLVGDNIYVFIRTKATKAFRQLVHPEEERVDKVVISGATPIGVEVARRLEGRVRKLILVDADREAAEAASEQVSRVDIVCGDVSDPTFAREYGLENADFFLALTNDDQTNLVHGLLAKNKEGAKRSGVLAQQPHYLDVLRLLGADIVVNPRLQTVNEILTHIRRGRILHVTRIGETGAEAREYLATQGCPIVGKPLKSAGMPRGAIVSAIIRGDTFEIPRGESIVQAGDHVVILALPEAESKVDRLFSRSKLFHR
ncbi:MAG: Trk system potassium transporter TrkA [Planctomycetota bacterium]